MMTLGGCDESTCTVEASLVLLHHLPQGLGLEALVANLPARVDA